MSIVAVNLSCFFPVQWFLEEEEEKKEASDAEEEVEERDLDGEKEEERAGSWPDFQKY